MSLPWVPAEEEVKSLSPGRPSPCSEAAEPRRQPGPVAPSSMDPHQPAAVSCRVGAQSAHLLGLQG